MDTVKIIMIDSGVGEFQKNLCKNHEQFLCEEEYVDTIGHGCAVFHILNSSDIEVECHKITDRDEIEEDVLLQKLMDLTRREDLGNTVINISMGITLCDKKEEFARVCGELKKKGSIIVAAFDNDGAVSYPAALPNVIGVDTSRKCRKLTEYEFVEGSIINIRGFGGVQQLPDIYGRRVSYIGSSFVAPHISLKVAKIIRDYKLDFDGVLSKLKENAIKIYRAEQTQIYRQKKPKIKRAIALPLNKEIRNLLRYPELLTFEINGVYDFHHMRVVNKKVSHIIGKEIMPDLIVGNVCSIDWDGDFDTVILGHMEEINHTLHINYTEQIIKEARTHGKKVYAFDPLHKFSEAEDIDFVYIDKSYIPENRFGKQCQIHCPVVGIFGTSSKQGKFTLQLELRKRFINRHYNIAQLSTEPNGLLYGMDAVYPMGYGGNIGVSSYDEIMVINNIVDQIVKDDTDLLLLGSQSQTVAYSSQNASLYALENANLLLATFPDIIILCVNYFDDFDYIVRTIRYLEGIVDSKVIAIVVSPFQIEYSGSSMLRTTYYASDKDILECLVRLQERTGIRTFRLNQEKEIDELCNLCIEVLSQGES